MAGLLNNPMLQLGAGLLAGGGPSLNPANATFGNALAGGLNNLNAMEQEGFKRQLLAEKLRMERERQSMQRQEMQQQQAAERQKQQQIRGLLDSIPDPAMRAQAEGLIAAGGVGSVAGLLNPTPAKPPASVQEYQFAVDQGFPGSYQEWVQSKRPQTNVTTNVGNTEKPLSTDAAKWANAEGVAPNPMMTPAQASAAGFNPISAAEQERLKRSVKSSIYEDRVKKYQSEYDDAAKAFGLSKSDANRRRLNSAAHSLAAAKGQALNIEGEPSDFVARGFNVPGSMGAVLAPWYDALMGAGESGAVPAAPAAPAIPSIPTAPEVFQFPGAK